MIKTILLYGFLTAMILSLAMLLILIPSLKPENVDPASGILKFFVLIGSMYFAINHYLKDHNAKRKYAYGIGIIICLGTGIVGVFLFGITAPMTRGSYNILVNLPTAVASVLLFMVPNLLMSLLIPAAFISRTKSQGQMNEEEILDANL